MSIAIALVASSLALANPPDLTEPLRTGAERSQDAAVLFGAEDYAYLPDVPFAERDADLIEDLLRYTVGIPDARIHRVTRPNRENMTETLAEAGATVGPGGTLYLYFAGHGAASPEDGGRVLLGVDTTPEAASFTARSLRLDEAVTMGSAGGGHVLVVADSCYSGAGRDGAALVKNHRFAVPSYALRAPSSSEWLAAGPNEWSGPWEPARHGAFTYFAAGALRGWADGEVDGEPDGKVTGAEAHAYVRRALRVVGVTRQTPEWVGEDFTLVESDDLESGPDLVALAKLEAPSTPAKAPTAAPASDVPDGFPSWYAITDGMLGLSCDADAQHTIGGPLPSPDHEVKGEDGVETWYWGDSPGTDNPTGLKATFQGERLLELAAGVKGLKMLERTDYELGVFGLLENKERLERLGAPSDYLMVKDGRFQRWAHESEGREWDIFYLLNKKDKAYLIEVSGLQHCP